MKTLLLQIQAQTLIGFAGLAILLSMYGTALGAFLEASGETLLRRGEKLIRKPSAGRSLQKHKVLKRKNTKVHFI